MLERFLQRRVNLPCGRVARTAGRLRRLERRIDFVLDARIDAVQLALDAHDVGAHGRRLGDQLAGQAADFLAAQLAMCRAGGAGNGAHDRGKGRGELLERRCVVEGAGAQHCAAPRVVAKRRLAVKRVEPRAEVCELRRRRVQCARADSHARATLRRGRDGLGIIVAGAGRAVHLVLEAGG